MTFLKNQRITEPLIKEVDKRLNVTIEQMERLHKHNGFIAKCHNGCVVGIEIEILSQIERCEMNGKF